MALSLTEAFTTVPGIPDWRLDAACRDTDPALFFPIGTTGSAVDQIASARQVCDLCNAKETCLEFAIQTNQDSGVWGGKTEDERRVIRRRLRAEALHERQAEALREEQAAAQTELKEFATS